MNIYKYKGIYTHILTNIRVVIKSQRFYDTYNYIYNYTKDI